MGVTIHYTATLKSPHHLRRLLDEIADLIEEAGWEATPIGPDPIDIPGSDVKQAEGFLLNIHPEMEPVNLIFDDTGRMVSFFHLLYPSMLDGLLDEMFSFLKRGKQAVAA